MAAMLSAERANQKKKANACLISHIEKKNEKKKKLEALYRILCTYVSKINI